jgi:hypothetical protein
MLAGVKTCPRCRHELPLEEFNFKNRATGRRQRYCRPCSRAFGRDHYIRNKRYYVAKAQARKAFYLPRLHERLLEYWRAHPCVDCGEADLAVLELDHIEPRARESNVGDRIKLRRGWRIIFAEIEKCVVRCANCHRRRTAQRFGWYRRMLAQGARSSVG